MSSSQFDMPLSPSAEQVRRREFVTIRRGYSPDQVRAYLQQVGDQIEALEKRLQSARTQTSAETPASAQTDADAETVSQRIRDEAYSQLSERMVDLLRAADRHADGIRQEGRNEVDRMIADARAEADRIRLDSQAHAEDVLRKAEELMRNSKNQADRVVGAISSRRTALELELEELDEMHERMRSMVQSIDGMERGALEQPEAGIIAETEGSPSVEPPVIVLPGSPLVEPKDSIYARIWGDEPGGPTTSRAAEAEEPPA